jgi:hypothetical protein
VNVDEDLTEGPPIWVDGRPQIARLVCAAKWKKTGTRLHPLSAWLTASANHDDAMAFFDALEEALAVATGDVRPRVRRLVGSDEADYWSALTELYLAAALRTYGLSSTLGNPDIVVAAADGSKVAVELTSTRQSADASRLHDTIARDWPGRYQAHLKIPDDRTRITLTQALAIRAAMIQSDAAIESLESEREREVDISSIIPPDHVRAYLNGGSPHLFVTTSGASRGVISPWPDIERRAKEKSHQLSGYECGVVAVEGGNGPKSAYIWADQVKAGDIVPALDVAANIAGVLLFWTDIRQHKPFRSVFVANGSWTGPYPIALTALLVCAGAS